MRNISKSHTLLESCVLQPVETSQWWPWAASASSRCSHKHFTNQLIQQLQNLRLTVSTGQAGFDLVVLTLTLIGREPPASPTPSPTARLCQCQRSVVFLVTGVSTHEADHFLLPLCVCMYVCVCMCVCKCVCVIFFIQGKNFFQTHPGVGMGLGSICPPSPRSWPMWFGQQ